jgi:hypothetical protein
MVASAGDSAFSEQPNNAAAKHAAARVFREIRGLFCMVLPIVLITSESYHFSAFLAPDNSHVDGCKWHQFLKSACKQNQNGAVYCYDVQEDHSFDER